MDVDCDDAVSPGLRIVADRGELIAEPSMFDDLPEAPMPDPGSPSPIDLHTRAPLLTWSSTGLPEPF